jgi:hypothetical protein
MPKRKKNIAPAQFKIGDKVRVKYGVEDVDYPDMPLGGWAGKIDEIQGADSFSIRWSKETMEAIHPVFKQRCEIDGLDPEEYVLTGDDLEPDVGGPLNIEHPKKIATKPLSPKDQDDRIRMALGLTSNDPLPDVDNETLEIFYRYLLENLLFPFQAEHGAVHGYPERVKVISLGDPDKEPDMIDDMYGILCQARMEGHSVTLPLGELEDAKPNRQMIDDYSCWFWNYR